MSDNWFSRLKQGLSKTRNNTFGKIARIVKSSGKLDEETLDSIEESLLLADIGPEIVMDLIDTLKERASEEKQNDLSFVMKCLEDEVQNLVDPAIEAVPAISAKPWVILVVGVNGSGKTTTIGKMTHQYMQEGKKVLLAAGDTFRAAAGEQLELWAERSGAGIIRHQEGADPASVAYDAVEAAKARGVDVLIIDTAGRLHTKVNLMEELKKIQRVVKKHNDEYPHETILVMDGTTGQNALMQAKSFHQAVTCTSVVVTKLDGTAKGGMIVALQKEVGLPVRMIGIGEGAEDLKPFHVREYVHALFDVGEK